MLCVDENDLAKVLKSVLGMLDKWDDLGMALGIKVSELNVIEKEKPTLQNRMKAMLRLWLQGNGVEPNWQNLCKALRDDLVKRSDIASKIEKDTS